MTRPAFQPVPVHSDIDRLASEITPLAGQIQAEEQSQKRVSAETCAAALRDIAPHVNARPAVTRWRAESCDYGMADRRIAPPSLNWPSRSQEADHRPAFSRARPLSGIVIADNDATWSTICDNPTSRR